MLCPSFLNSRSGSSRRGSALAARVTGSNRRRTRTREPYVPPKSRPAAATAPASVTAGQQRRARRSLLGEGLRGDATRPRERGGVAPPQRGQRGNGARPARAAALSTPGGWPCAGRRPQPASRTSVGTGVEERRPLPLRPPPQPASARSNYAIAA